MNTKTEKEFLGQYNANEFESPLVTVDLCIFTLIDNDLKVLMVKRSSFPEKGKLALPGGFIDLSSDSNIEETALRKLLNKTGVKSPYLEQVSTIGNKSRDPRGWSVTTLYFALLPYVDVIKANEFGDEVKWLSMEDVAISSMAFDHKELIHLARERLANKVSYTDIGFHVLPQKFTLSQLQKAFEILMDHKLEKKSFRRRMMAADLVQELDEVSAERGRPAALYQAKSKQPYFFARSL
ncbi:MAG: NUDIX domain-containing protein [Marinicellaceae bacterium]